MFSSHPRTRKRNSQVSVNDSINCLDHCFRSHNKDGACMETLSYIPATEWLLAISISPSIVSSLDMSPLLSPGSCLHVTQNDHKPPILCFTFSIRRKMSCCLMVCSKKNLKEA